MRHGTITEVILSCWLCSSGCCHPVCRKEGIEVRVVKRGEYDEEVVRWADAIVSAGGRLRLGWSSTMMMV